MFLLVFISANINAEISGVNIRNLTQLYNNQISKVLVGNKLFSHIQKKKLRAIVCHIHEDWSDIGHLEEYNNSNII